MFLAVAAAVENGYSMCGLKFINLSAGFYGNDAQCVSVIKYLTISCISRVLYAKWLNLLCVSCSSLISQMVYMEMKLDLYEL